MIGTFGEVVFETSDSRILTFTGFTRDVESRFAEHEIIGKKPRTEHIGPALDSISFTVSLNGNFGISVREEMDRWVRMTRDGEAHLFVIGSKALGMDLWTIQSVSEAWDVIANNGVLLSGKVDVTLQEYISKA